MASISWWTAALASASWGAIGAAGDAVPRARALAHWLLLILLITIIALTGFMVIRSTRWMRDRVTRRKPKPTDATDVWAMHRLPDEMAEDDGGNGNGSGRQ